jgi:hypothetical protein
MNTFRFFAVVMRPPGAFVALAMATLGFGAYLERVYPEGFDQALAIALFLQTLAASTGYRYRLRLGHFDPVLVGGGGRWRIALAHWVASVGLGLLVWAGLGGIDLARGGGHWPTAFSPAALVAALYVSTTVWMLSLGLGRYAGGLLWLTILFALASTQRLQGLRVMFSNEPETWQGLFRSAEGALVCPLFMFIDTARTSAVLVTLILIATVATWLIGVAQIVSFDGALGEG